MEKVANGVINGLKQQPLALALVAVNAMFLVALFWIMGSISENAKVRDAMILQLVKDCSVK